MRNLLLGVGDYCLIKLFLCRRREYDRDREEKRSHRSESRSRARSEHRSRSRSRSRSCSKRYVLISCHKLTALCLSILNFIFLLLLLRCIIFLNIFTFTGLMYMVQILNLHAIGKIYSGNCLDALSALAFSDGFHSYSLHIRPFTNI